jgi:NitT/TauT family transport system substrate-binding protein
MRRKTALATAAAALAAPSQLRAQAEISLRVAAAIQDTNAQAYYAEAAGFFKSANLKVEIMPFVSTGAIVSALIGGAIDVATAGPLSVVAAREQGIPLAIVAPGGVFEEAAPTTLLMAAKTSTIKSAHDLEGKTVATPSLHGLTEISVGSWMAQNHADAASVKYVEMPFPTMPPALERGQIDAAVIAEPSLALAKLQTRELANVYAAIAKQWYISAWFVHENWLAKNHEAAHAFVGAIARTQAWANTHHTETAKTLQTVAKLSDDNIARLVRVRYGTALDARLLQPLLDASAKIGVTKGTIGAREMLVQV